MTIDTKDLQELVKRVLTDRLFCGDETHRTLATGVESLLAEIQALRMILPLMYMAYLIYRGPR